MLLLQSEQQRQEVEEMAVAVLQRVTDQTNKAQDRAHSLEVRGQTGLHSGSHKIALCSITVMINYIYVTQFEK